MPENYPRQEGVESQFNKGSGSNTIKKPELAKVIIDYSDEEKGAKQRQRIHDAISRTQAKQAERTRKIIMNDPDLELPTENNGASLDLDKDNMGVHVEPQDEVLFDASQFGSRDKFGEGHDKNIARKNDDKVPTLKAPSGRRGETTTSGVAFGATDVSNTQGHDRHRFSHNPKTEGLSNVVEGTDSATVAIEKIIKRLKDEWDVKVDSDGTASGFFNRRKVNKLEKNNPEFAKLTEQLVSLNRQVENEVHRMADVRVTSHIDKTQPQKSAGRNVLTGN